MEFSIHNPFLPISSFVKIGSQYIDLQEDNTLEFKTGYPKDYLIKYLIGFANTNGGVIIFGICDDGYIEGLDIRTNNRQWMDKIRLYIDKMCRANITPQLRDVSVYFEEMCDDRFLIRIHIQKSDYHHTTLDGISYTRLNSSIKMDLHRKRNDEYLIEQFQSLNKKLEKTIQIYDEMINEDTFSPRKKRKLNDLRKDLWFNIKN